jgi:hypothetical protein
MCKNVKQIDILAFQAFDAKVFDLTFLEGLIFEYFSLKFDPDDFPILFFPLK